MYNNEKKRPTNKTGQEIMDEKKFQFFLNGGRGILP